MAQLSGPTKRASDDVPDFLKIPLAAIGQVFTQLDTWKDGLRLSLVCHQLREAGKPYLQRRVACVNCLNPLTCAAAASQANAGSRSFPFSLDDGDAMCLGEPEDIIPGSIRFEKEGPCKNRCLPWEFLRLRLSRTTQDLGLRVRHAHCNRCDLYLGVQIMEIKGLRLGDDLDMSSWRLGLLLGNIFVAVRYICALDPNGSEDTTLPGITWQDRAPRKIYTCAMRKLRSGANGNAECDWEMCGLPIFDDRAILSKDHWWKAQDVPVPHEASIAAVNDGGELPPTAVGAQDLAGLPLPLPLGAATAPDAAAAAADAGAALLEEQTGNESDDGEDEDEDSGEPAWYINHVEVNLIEESLEEMDLAQGRMKVARVWCPGCQRVLGWRFKECLEGGRNAHHCGRVGVLLNRVKEEPLRQGYRQNI